MSPATQLQLQAQVVMLPPGLLDHKRYLELSGIAAWARPELDYILDRIGWPLREKEWGPHQASVERILRSVDDLNVALGTLQTEMAPQADFAWSS